MSHTGTTKVGAAIGTAALASLLLASPALAKPGPSTPASTTSVRAGDVRQMETTSVSGSASVLPGDVRRMDGQPTTSTPGGSSTATRVVVKVDDNAVELAQVGLGVLAGLAVAGLGISTAGAMRRRHVPGTA
jgi:hypothetical protein